jgi:CCR4-NOT transcription complex subunit 1
MTLGLALRFVLDALRKPSTSKMYCFGIAALDRFKSRLKDYHKYCEHVAAIQHFCDFPPHLIEVTYIGHVHVTYLIVGLCILLRVYPSIL